ncbi:hypothetical protein OROMI_009985 [Orobanche minor]
MGVSQKHNSQKGVLLPPHRGLYSNTFLITAATHQLPHRRQLSIWHSPPLILDIGHSPPLIIDLVSHLRPGYFRFSFTSQRDDSRSASIAVDDSHLPGNFTTDCGDFHLIHDDFTTGSRRFHDFTSRFPSDPQILVSQMDLATLIQNEDFNAISQVAVASNTMISDNEVDEYDDIGDEEEDVVDITQEHEVPSTFTSMEETNTTTDNNWIVPGASNKNDFTRELGKDSFKDKEELIRAIKLHSIRTHKQFEVVETRQTPWSIKCKLNLQSRCKWHLRACKRKRSGYFEITTYAGPHTCALQKFNPGTIVEWYVARSTDEEHVEFRRVFWAFAPSIKGFVHCRPVISIDGTHLYGKYKGKMLIAMGVDGNNQILPLAFAIVENESYDSWDWFLSHIKNHVVKERDDICLICDRHIGILKVVNKHGSPCLEPRGIVYGIS